jgi:hypothetical protein
LIIQNLLVKFVTMLFPVIIIMKGYTKYIVYCLCLFVWKWGYCSKVRIHVLNVHHLSSVVKLLHLLSIVNIQHVHELEWAKLFRKSNLLPWNTNTSYLCRLPLGQQYWLSPLLMSSPAAHAWSMLQSRQ